MFYKQKLVYLEQNFSNLFCLSPLFQKSSSFRNLPSLKKHTESPTNGSCYYHSLNCANFGNNDLKNLVILQTNFYSYLLINIEVQRKN